MYKRGIGMGRRNKARRKNKKLKYDRNKKAFKSIEQDSSGIKSRKNIFISRHVTVFIFITIIILLPILLRSSNNSKQIPLSKVPSLETNYYKEEDMYFEQGMLRYLDIKGRAYSDRIRNEYLAKYEKELEEHKRLEEQKKLEEQRRLEEKKKNETKTFNRQNTKTAYLTFDDGPSASVTPIVLDILKKNDIKATFFLVGQMAKGAPELVKRIYNEGHKVANHSYTHNYNNIYAHPDNMMREIIMTEAAFKEILGEGFRNSLFRFPGGMAKPEFIERLQSEGFHHELWTSLTRDAEISNPTKNQLVEAFKSTFRSNTNEIILMHDIKTITAEYLQEVIDYIRDKGYTFKAME